MTQNKKTILIVDDTINNLDVLLELLDDYDVIDSTNGKDALQIAAEEHLDLILLDIMMPDMDGYEVCERLKSNPQTQDIPVIFITAKTDEESIVNAYNIGGVDYITKPFKPQELLTRVKTHIILHEHAAELERLTSELFTFNQLLEEKVNQKTAKIRSLYKEIQDTQKEIIFTVGTIAEGRSKETSNHVKRVARYSRILARAYGMRENKAELLMQASPMHDIGKIAIPDAILNKPARLDAEEMRVMQTHATLGYNMLAHSERPLLKTAAIIAHEHHERWDGTGYPRGLTGNEIHIYGRITALADVFDALGSARVYKPAWDDDKIFRHFKKESGRHFEPELVNLFFENLNAFLEVRDSFKDVT